jgi:putative restriction endonuclease
MNSRDVANGWLKRFAALRVDLDPSKGRAPHKALLLLAVLDLFEDGQLADGWVTLSADLVARFQNFWPIVQERRANRGDIRMPFHALGTDRVWSVFDVDGRPSLARETSVRAKLPDDLLELLGDAAFRAELRRLLAVTYFPVSEQIALFAALGFEEAVNSLGLDAQAQAEPIYRLARDTGRSARFKNQVVSGYRFTCALTGYRITTAEQLGIVEAAHIHALASSRNNDSDNGLALTPTAHALFDLGLWSVTDELRILVKPEQDFLEETPAGGFSLRGYSGRPLHILTGVKLRPHPAHLAWHRRQHNFYGLGAG